MNDPRYSEFPDGFFDRRDPSNDRWFYDEPRIVNHIDDGAIEGVGSLYERLGISGRVLDLMGSWVSHFQSPPEQLVVHGMNVEELAQNHAAGGALVADLNAHPSLPFRSGSFDAVVCTVSVDYLSRPLEVFDEISRVLQPGGLAVMNFSNRLFPTKAIRGWLGADDHQRCSIVETYFRLARGFGDATAAEVQTSGRDPLYAVWATTIS